MSHDSFTLCEIIEYEDGDPIDLDGRQHPTIRSDAWFTPHERERLASGIPLVAALEEVWERSMRSLDSYNHGWTSFLQASFGEDINPKQGSTLMTLFMWLGTNNGSGLIADTFRGQHALIIELDKALALKHVPTESREAVLRVLQELSRDKERGVRLPWSPLEIEGVRPIVSYDYGDSFACELFARFWKEQANVPRWFKDLCGREMGDEGNLLLLNLFQFICTPDGAEMINAAYKTAKRRPPIKVQKSYS